MEQYISKSALVAEIEDKINKYTKRGEESDAKRDGYAMYWGGVLSCLNEVRSFIDTLEVKEVKEEPVNEDLEDYAKKESESFAEREYEIDYIDRNTLAKGYYWGVKAGAEWMQKQLNNQTVILYGLQGQ